MVAKSRSAVIASMEMLRLARMSEITGRVAASRLKANGRFGPFASVEPTTVKAQMPALRASIAARPFSQAILPQTQAVEIN